MIAASLGKMPTTSARRLTSLLSRSSGLVLCNLLRCGSGKSRYDSTSVSLSSINAASFGHFDRNWSAAWRSIWLAWARSGCKKAWRSAAATVVGTECIGGCHTSRQKAAAQGTVGDKADAERLAKRQDFTFHVARPQRIFDLQGGERMHRVRPPDGCCPGLADAEKAYLALTDKLAHRADRVLDRNGRIDPMDVIEVDDVGLEPPEALL